MSKRDSISQCDPNKGLYDLHSASRSVNPEIVLLNTSTQDPDIDNRLLSRLNKNTIWKGLGLLFKYVFMIFLVPPYLLFYGLPKWLIQKSWPVLSKFAKGVSFKFGQIYSKSILAIKKILPSKEGIKRVLLWNKVKNGVGILSTHLKKLYLTCIKHLKTVYNVCSIFISRTFSFMKDFSSEQKRKRILMQLHKLALSLMRSPKAGLLFALSKIRGLGVSIRAFLAKTGALIVTLTVKYRDRIKQLAEILKSPIIRLKEFIKRQYDLLKVKLPVLVLTLFAPIKVFFDKVMKFKERCKFQVLACWAASQTFFGKTLAPIKLRAYSILQLLSKPMETIKALGYKVKALWMKIRAFMTTVNTYARKLNWTTVRLTGERLAKKTFAFLKEMGKKITETWNRLNLMQKFLPQALRSIASKYTQKAVYGGQVIFALLRIFPKYIFKIMGDLFIELKQRFP